MNQQLTDSDIKALISHLDHNNVASIILDKNLECLWMNKLAQDNFAASKKPFQFHSFITKEKLSTIIDEINKTGYAEALVPSSFFVPHQLKLMSANFFGYNVDAYIAFLIKDETKLKFISPNKAVFAIVANLFRDPLSITFANLFPFYCKKIADNDPTDIQYINTIYRNSYKILRSVSNISDIYRFLFEEKSLKLINYDYSEIIKNIVESACHVLKGKAEIHVHIPDDACYIFAFDKDRIETVILNLISNSIIFTDKEPIIDITVKKVNNSVITTVSDNGQGISNETLSNIFTAFYSVSKEGTTPYKAGLGLPLSKLIIESHQGSININNKEGEGTTVAFSLPYTQNENIDMFESPSVQDYLTDTFSKTYIQLCDLYEN